MLQRFYVPGMISLIGILPLFYFKAKPWVTFFKQRAMTVYLPFDGYATDGLIGFYEDEVVARAETKKKHTYYLNHYLESREEVLNHIRHTVQEMKFGYDTSSVVKVVLGQNCSFNDLVSVLNICLAEELRRYAWVQDSIFIFAPDPPRQQQYAICPMLPVEYLEFPEEKNCMRDAYDYFKSNKLIIFGLLPLFLCGLFQIILSFRTSKNTSGMLHS